MGVEVLVLVVTVVVLLWAYTRHRHSYWSKRGVLSPPTLPFFGHFFQTYLINKRIWLYNQENYVKFYDSLMYGTYELFKPVLVTWDLEIMKHVFIKNFDHFTDRRDFNMKTGKERDEMMSEMLSLKAGEEWKILRAIMSPTFTSGKMKSMFPLVCDKADALVKSLLKQASQNMQVNMKNIFGRYTMDTIGSCAFGIECNSLIYEQNDDFTRRAEILFKPPGTALLKGVFYAFFPKLFKMTNLTLNSAEIDFFIYSVNHTVAARQAGEKRGDFLDLLLEARDTSDNTDSKHVLSDRCLVAQSVLFIVAGYETTASLLAFATFLLARHKEQQQRLRTEIKQIVADHGDITYQSIMESKLLDAFLQETLRLYPPAVLTERTCTKTFKLPGTDITMNPGDLIQVPIWSLHHDPQHWPDPEAFIPDRFLPENKANIRPFTHMPFGMGPRNCIAMRFALMEAKVAIAKLLLNVELELSHKNQELVLETNSGLLSSIDGVKLVLRPIKGT